MTITKEVETTQMTVLSDGQIQIQEKTTVAENGVVLSTTFHREVLDPANEIGVNDSRGKPWEKRILDLVTLTHTTEVKEARKAFLAKAGI